MTLPLVQVDPGAPIRPAVLGDPTVAPFTNAGGCTNWPYRVPGEAAPVIPGVSVPPGGVPQPAPSGTQAGSGS